MADEEVVCPKPELEERCKPRCVKYLLEYEVNVMALFLWHIAMRGFLLLCGMLAGSG